MLKLCVVQSRPAIGSTRQANKNGNNYMNKLVKIAVGSLLLVAAPLSIACDYPERPAIPDGSTATKEELLAAKDAVGAFLADVDTYLTCIENTEKEAVAALEEAKPEDLKRREDMLNSKFDAANEEKALVGEQFNQQVRAYNAARKADD